MCLEESDAILCPQNRKLQPKRNISKFILEAGQLTREDILPAAATIVPTGQASASPAGKLSCKHLIHAVVPHTKQGLKQPDKQRLFASAVFNALTHANNLGCKTASVPALVMSPEQADLEFLKLNALITLRVLIGFVQAALSTGVSLQLSRVRFVNAEGPRHDAFRSALLDMFRD